jgi:hypothetical protein
MLFSTKGMYIGPLKAQWEVTLIKITEKDACLTRRCWRLNNRLMVKRGRLADYVSCILIPSHLYHDHNPENSNLYFAYTAFTLPAISTFIALSLEIGWKTSFDHISHFYPFTLHISENGSKSRKFWECLLVKITVSE